MLHNIVLKGFFVAFVQTCGALEDDLEFDLVLEQLALAGHVELGAEYVRIGAEGVQAEDFELAVAHGWMELGGCARARWTGPTRMLPTRKLIQNWEVLQARFRPTNPRSGRRAFLVIFTEDRRSPTSPRGRARTEGHNLPFALATRSIAAAPTARPAITRRRLLVAFPLLLLLA